MPKLPSVPDDSTRKQDTLLLTHSFFQRGDIVGRSLYETLPTKTKRKRPSFRKYSMQINLINKNSLDFTAVNETFIDISILSECCKQT